MLTGPAIAAGVRDGDIVIDPFDPDRLCANSYSFTLADRLLSYRVPEAALDPYRDTPVTDTVVPATGYVLQPGRLYLGATRETMGATSYAATLHGCRSVSTLGLRIQLSAPLGHSGAIIAWTLELRAAVPVRVYPGMTIGKIAFWPMSGCARQYAGRYRGSTGPVRSLLADSDRSQAPAVTAPAGPSAAFDSPRQ